MSIHLNFHDDVESISAAPCHTHHAHSTLYISITIPSSVFKCEMSLYVYPYKLNMFNNIFNCHWRRSYWINWSLTLLLNMLLSPLSTCWMLEKYLIKGLTISPTNITFCCCFVDFATFKPSHHVWYNNSITEFITHLLMSLVFSSFVVSQQRT